MKMTSLSEIKIPDIGQTIILKEVYGAKKIKKIKCTVEEIYKSFILVERMDNRTKESFMKVDFYTGFLQYDCCLEN